ncbi:uncharacterized protein NECHADRAFT_75043 [Fusarium vanettenii 77-13-4]|uniref:Uncharacterized protein n=1 Tax=Fusarium vanettenii (strain ATCC MYA-4622 / CBS 123669 / FGSC 9596 / NRRL 45880 / 77-13-4) TaxID=660122 RepID=C7YHP5_FUSV7|nr:uncharacterized protein NECHADRAFT_75043 [Fusarium vanettenii 77-13-4]EEU47948.1 hypothetical protein NECHADRAFT_75043 [Fusarium vanettenii 77-13-4]
MASEESAITIQFTTVSKLFEEIYSDDARDALVVQNVSQQDYIDIDNERELRRRKFRLKRYYSERQILIVTIPTEAHELLYAPLSGHIHAAVIQMGLGSQWTAMGSTTWRDHRNGDEGEGDSSGGPRNRQGPRWPTLIIESGYSQTLESLRRDMKWWFSASNYQVKIVLLVKLDPSSEEIIMETWQVAQGETTSTEPSCSQVITVSGGPNADTPDTREGLEATI